MPVAELLVEGELEHALLVALYPPGGPAIVKGAGKGSLAPRTRQIRKDKEHIACYLRDRDFDYEPPEETSEPTVDARHEDTVLGWRWCRHEIESYLLEPAIIHAATTWDLADYTAALVDGARNISYYTAARWLLGLHRRIVDSQRLFRTRPAWDNEMKVPDDLSCEPSAKFLLDTIDDWQQRVTRPADDELRRHHNVRAQRLLALQTADEILLWHGGKDLFAAIEPQIRARYRIDPKTFSRRIRNWVREHPADALAHLPEWTALFRCIAAES